MPTIPKTVYQTPNPERNVSECYTIFADVLPNATDPQKCWVVKEKHGYWDEQETVGDKFKNKVVTLSPNDPVHCVTMNEAFAWIDRQVTRRANEGFKYLFVLDPSGPPWHTRYEIQPDGTPVQF